MRGAAILRTDILERFPRTPAHIDQEHGRSPTMNKLLIILAAGLFLAGQAMAQDP
jgi:hypothetical protein